MQWVNSFGRTKLSEVARTMEEVEQQGVGAAAGGVRAPEYNKRVPGSEVSIESVGTRRNAGE